MWIWGPALDDKTLEWIVRHTTDAAVEWVLCETQLTDAMLAHFSGDKVIRTLMIDWTRVTAGGLPYLKSCPNLKTLFLTGTAIKWDDLERSGLLKQLSIVQIDTEQMAGRSLDDLKKSHPHLTIHVE